MAHTRGGDPAAARAIYSAAAGRTRRHSAVDADLKALRDEVSRAMEELGGPEGR